MVNLKAFILQIQFEIEIKIETVEEQLNYSGPVLNFN